LLNTNKESTFQWQTITGTISIPTSEVKADGIYTGLTLQLLFISAGVESVNQTAQISTSNQCNFTFEDGVRL
jgi:hypothetical protein